MLAPIFSGVRYARCIPPSVGSARTIREPLVLRHQRAWQICYHLLPMNSGELAEQRAAQYLQQRGLKLVAKNYRSRYGEIDLIMQDGATLVFVEVRLRSGDSFGGAAASIDARKQRRIIRTAQQYLNLLAHIPPCRIDAVLLENDDVLWIRNAFET